MEDHELIELYWARDEQAILQTAVRYGKLCQQISVHILGNRQDAEECVNDTYLKLWNSMPPERPRSLSAFISRVTRNIAIDKYRSLHRKSYNRDLEVALEELADITPEDTSQEVLGELIRLFLRQTDVLDRRLFLGRYWYAASVKTLAKAWGLTPNAVSLRLYKTREKFKVFLTERGYRYE